MPSENSDRRPARAAVPAPPSCGSGEEAQPPPPQQHLPCPRCDSTNTKFCYYNNYNLSQPRHFCKSCRRYWTQGGTLRDVPVGGGSRSKPHSHKRSRTTTTTSSSATSASMPQQMAAIPTVGPACELLPAPEFDPMGSFSALLASSASPGFLGLSDPGMARAGVGLGFDGMGFGLGRGGWPVASDLAEDGAAATWHVGLGGDGFNDGDCFGWPDLAISTPGNGCLP